MNKKAKIKIIFMCAHNSARSQMAEGSEKFGEYEQK